MNKELQEVKMVGQCDCVCRGRSPDSENRQADGWTGLGGQCGRGGVSGRAGGRRGVRGLSRAEHTGVAEFWRSLRSELRGH